MNPRSRKGAAVDSTDVETEQPLVQSFDNLYTPPAQEIEVVPAASGGGGDPKLFDELRFMEEMVEVMVHESTDENAENPVFTACNGVTQYFFRGRPVNVKRKFVNILASCKEHGLSTPEAVGPDGGRTTLVRRTSSLKYPFSVIHDPNPRGADWLRKMLRAAT